jgi:two-component system, LytTR family, response regulator
MLRTIIVDDEAPARSRLRRLLAPFAESGKVELVAEAGDGVEALELLQERPVDLLLLDIQMPGMSGFDVLDRMPPTNRPVVIFVTAYDQYAVRAFEAAAVDYLLKPIAGDRLALALDRAERLSGSKGEIERRLADLLDILDRRPAVSPTDNGFLRQISIPGADRLTVVPIAQVLSAEVEDGLTRIFVLHEQIGQAPRVSRHTITQPLDALERRLDPDEFMRVHRSALIQLNHVHELVSWFSGRYKVVLTGGHEVIASRARSKDLRDRMSL